MLAAAEQNHRSWFGRARELVTVDTVDVYLGQADAVLAFPSPDADVRKAVAMAQESGAREIGCWALLPSDLLGRHLAALGFQDGWQPHWMGRALRSELPAGEQAIEESQECSDRLPYGAEGHGRPLGGDIHHFVARAGSDPVGHAVLNIEQDSAGIYDMGVAREARRQGYGRSLTLAALMRARASGCTSVTLNATAEGEALYRAVGFESLGLGMTWWWFLGHSPRASRPRRS
jgi:ribosomal protein S18 acetylase RimI-like enzyme